MTKLLTFIAVIGCTFLASGSALATDVPQLTISGRTFYKDGKEWLPKGVGVEAFSKPARVREKAKRAAQVRSYWGVAELSAIKNMFQADTLRFQLSQSGLDPESPAYDGSYVQDILEGVRTGQGAGFAVILAIDAQQDGVPALACMPSDSTNRAWKSIAPSFVHDPGVMFELFNEPCKWRDADSQKEWARSMQMLIDTVRGVGSTNILLLDGLRWARSTNGLFPLVQDKVRDRLALAAHPYLAKNFITEEQWRNEFGASAAQYPLIASEWNAVTQGSHCVGSNTPALALSMIHYLKSLHVGLIGWAIDWNEPMLVKDHTSYEPTDYAAFRFCDDGSNSGAGKLLADYPNE